MSVEEHTRPRSRGLRSAERRENQGVRRLARRELERNLSQRAFRGTLSVAFRLLVALLLRVE